MVNSVLLDDQYMIHFLKMVQVLSHAVVHPQVCVDPIHNEVPKLIEEVAPKSLLCTNLFVAAVRNVTQGVRESKIMTEVNDARRVRVFTDKRITCKNTHYYSERAMIGRKFTRFY